MQVVNLPVEAQGQQWVSFFGPCPPFCLVFRVWNWPQGCIYFHFPSVGLQLHTTMPDFFFLNMGSGCWACVLRPSSQVLHQVSCLCRLRTICFNQWPDDENIVFRCRFIVQVEWICFMKDQCAHTLPFVMWLLKVIRLSYMFVGSVYVCARRCISVLGHEPCIVYSSSISKCKLTCTASPGSAQCAGLRVSHASFPVHIILPSCSSPQVTKDCSTTHFQLIVESQS